MNLTLTTPAAIAAVIVLGLVLSSLFIVIICVAAQRLPGARFDEHQAQALAAEDYDAAIDQALANGDGRPPFSCPGYGEITGSCCYTADSPKPPDCQLPDRPLAAVPDDEPTQPLAPVVHLVHDDVLGGPVLRINGARKRSGRIGP